MCYITGWILEVKNSPFSRMLAGEHQPGVVRERIHKASLEGNRD